jgi:hypothetical protein
VVADRREADSGRLGDVAGRGVRDAPFDDDAAGSGEKVLTIPHAAILRVSWTLVLDMRSRFL